jgi:hypothetical protein
MYKLLLVSDREDVLNAFGQIQNWERQGFKPPHIRHDYEGMLDSLSKHHADGIAVAVAPEEERKIGAYLQEFYPDVPLFQAGTTPEEVLRYLNELNILLNRIHADFSNDRFREIDMLQECRHEFFRKLMTGRISMRTDLFRNMRLLRSRMDPDKPCMMLELQQPPVSDQDRLTGRWHYGPDRLELALRNSFGGDIEGIHVLPTVQTDGRILVLCCPLKGVETAVTGDRMTALITSHIADGISHLKEFFGLELHISGIRVLPSLYVLCADETGKIEN